MVVEGEQQGVRILVVMVKTSKKHLDKVEKERKKHKKHKHKHKAHKDHKHKNRGKDKRKDKCERAKIAEDRKTVCCDERNMSFQHSPNVEPGKDDGDNYEIPVELMNFKSHAPETPSEYEKRQNLLRREVDPVTGRTRLIRGTGEILEELVSKKRHTAINKEATRSDGQYFEENTIGKAM